MSLHASRGRSVDSALHHAVEGVATAGNYRSLLSGDVPGDINLRGLSGTPRSRLEVVGTMVALAISAEQAEAQAHVQGQLSGGMEVILKVRFENLVAVVILGLGVGLGEIRDIAHQQISERVAAGNRRSWVEGEKSVGGRNGSRQLVFLRGNKV